MLLLINEKEFKSSKIEKKKKKEIFLARTTVFLFFTTIFFSQIRRPTSNCSSLVDLNNFLQPRNYPKKGRNVRVPETRANFPHSSPPLSLGFPIIIANSKAAPPFSM